MMQVVMNILPDKSPGKLEMSFDGEPGQLHTVRDLIIAHLLFGSQQIDLTLPLGQPGDNLAKHPSALTLLYTGQDVIIHYRRKGAKLCQVSYFNRMLFDVVEYQVAGEYKKIVLKAADIAQQPAAVPDPDIHLLYDLPGRFRIPDIGHHRIVQTRIRLLIQTAKCLLVTRGNQRQQRIIAV